MSDHPRERFDLQPNEVAELALLDAEGRGRLHHAWLVTGREGSGKATFAYRAARRLLGAAPDPARGALGARPDDPVSRLVAAQSHPDLLVLERLSDGGKLKRAISVDQARDLPDFFSKSPSVARRRVAIVDAADDLNVNAANALLKVLEEPPENGVLFLIAHAPGKLLPTIRSRCRRLAFAPWTEEQLTELLTSRLHLDRGAASAAASMAAGSPGAALALAAGTTSEFDLLAKAWVEGGDPDRAQQLAVMDGLRGAEGQARFEALIDRLSAAVLARARARGPGADRWAELWSRWLDLPDRTSGLNLDRGDVLAGALLDLQRTKAAAC
jgi:DNA polymerase III subunit delta'